MTDDGRWTMDDGNGLRSVKRYAAYMTRLNRCVRWIKMQTRLSTLF
jgi:hypothetical protein